jgi:LuxR family maltose regulon positive regulatory protein
VWRLLAEENEKISNRRFMDLEVVLATASVGALLAMAYLRAGARTDALIAFRKVLNAGQHVGLYQTILDQGPEIGALLLSVRDETAGAEQSTNFASYLDRLIEGYGARYTKSRRVTSARGAASQHPRGRDLN